MIEITGKYNTAKVYTDNLESSAVGQITALCNQEFTQDSKIRIMPDVHAGAGCTIGTTMTIKDKIVPNLVGVDISCFTGDTLIPLSNGLPDTAISDLVGKDIWVYAINSDNQIVPAKATCMKTKEDADIVDVELDNGEHIHCTPDHKFMNRDGSYTEAINLKEGQSLRPFVTSYDLDGYLFINQSYGVNKRQYNFHRFVMHYVLGYDIDDMVVHHKDGNKLNNTPDNLEIMEWSQHSKHHQDIREVKVFQTEEFKKHRKEVLDKKGYYRPEFYQIKAEPATRNITTYMKNNPEHFAKVVEENAKRFSKLARETNSSFYEQTRRRLRKLKKTVEEILPNDINEDNWEFARSNHYHCWPMFSTAKNTLNQFNMTWDELLDESCWEDKITYNHKVVKVTVLGEKQDVYCLNVPVHHNFALTSGIFVHNCGMRVVEIEDKKLDLQRLDKCIRNNVPHGSSDRSRFHRWAKEVHIEDMKCWNKLVKKKRDYRLAIGSLGSGNHFLEVDSDEEGNLYLVIHTGSRNLGLQVAKYYQDLAYIKLVEKLRGFRYKDEVNRIIDEYKAAGRTKEIDKAVKQFRTEYNRPVEIPYDLAYLEEDDFENYIHDMKIMQQFASMNRAAIADTIQCGMRFKIKDEWETVHNYIDTDNMILRKGSISAKKDEIAIIPMNMRDGSLIVKGKGNADWNYSAPHGAGRLMSRKDARNTIPMKDFKDSMKDIYSTSVSVNTVDEAPQAYKPMEEIVANISETVDIVKIIKPIYNFKAS